MVFLGRQRLPPFGLRGRLRRRSGGCTVVTPGHARRPLLPAGSGGPLSIRAVALATRPPGRDGGRLATSFAAALASAALSPTRLHSIQLFLVSLAAIVLSITTLPSLRDVAGSRRTRASLTFLRGGRRCAGCYGGPFATGAVRRRHRRRDRVRRPRARHACHRPSERRVACETAASCSEGHAGHRTCRTLRGGRHPRCRRCGGWGRRGRNLGAGV